MFMDIDEMLRADHVVPLTPTQYKYYRLYQQGHGIREIARMYGVAPATVCRCIKIAKDSIQRQREEAAVNGK